MATSEIVLFVALAAIVGAGMFLFVLYRTRQAERDNPPIGQFLEVDGVRLHYLERGQGMVAKMPSHRSRNRAFRWGHKRAGDTRDGAAPLAVLAAAAPMTYRLAMLASTSRGGCSTPAALNRRVSYGA